MLKSPTLPKVMGFFCFHLARADEQCLRPYGKDKGEDKISFIFMNTLYHSNNWLQMVPIFFQNHQWQPYLGVGSSLPSLPCPCRLSGASCYCPCCGSCGDPKEDLQCQWSGSCSVSEVPGQQPELWGQRATLGSPGWGCPAGICSGTFLYGSQTRLTVLAGVVARLIWAGWHSGYVVPLPHLDSDSSVYLGISRSLMNDLEIKLKQNQPKRFYCLKRFIGGNFKAFFFRWCCVWQADKWIMLINCYKVSLSFSLFLSLSLSSVHD